MNFLGKKLTTAFVLHMCSKNWVSGYGIMKKGKQFGASWSSGSFYPILLKLMDQNLIVRRDVRGRRLAYEYGTTPTGLGYLKNVSKELETEELRSFFTALLSDYYKK
ncbi:Uncharacterised protein [Candidatus Bilamarchaeum dharawalense]|uniref:Transcription regulator PadR N-terminal domain-containing protein n=1 Tax=Candidatus Bilamarchaeum dharawalense TaxID=2885759 RepID=A0A5E4LSQ0_9ARCH|nr:Uncharacterised protein [Candidatus Bilamarchaeum dharawalense]